MVSEGYRFCQFSLSALLFKEELALLAHIAFFNQLVNFFAIPEKFVATSEIRPNDNTKEPAWSKPGPYAFSAPECSGPGRCALVRSRQSKKITIPNWLTENRNYFDPSCTPTRGPHVFVYFSLLSEVQKLPFIELKKVCQRFLTIIHNAMSCLMTVRLRKASSVATVRLLGCDARQILCVVCATTNRFISNLGDAPTQDGVRRNNVDDCTAM